MNILIFGASITWGAWDKEQGGWANRLKLYFDRQAINSKFDNILYVYPLGISGNTSKDLLGRLRNEIETRTTEDEETLIILSIGINDSQSNLTTQENRVSPENYRQNIKQIVDIASKYTKKIVIVGLTSVDESKVNPTPWTPDWGYTNEQIDKYDQILKKLSEDNRIYFIDVLGKFAEKSDQLLSGDGLHPNSEGHELIFDTVKSYLLNNHIL